MRHKRHRHDTCRVWPGCLVAPHITVRVLSCPPRPRFSSCLPVTWVTWLPYFHISQCFETNLRLSVILSPHLSIRCRRNLYGLELVWRPKELPSGLHLLSIDFVADRHSLMTQQLGLAWTPPSSVYCQAIRTTWWPCTWNLECLRGLLTRWTLPAINLYIV